MALADGLVEQHSGGGGGVKGVNLSKHGNGEDKITVFPHQSAHALSFTANDNSGGDAEICVNSFRSVGRLETLATGTW